LHKRSNGAARVVLLVGATRNETYQINDISGPFPGTRWRSFVSLFRILRGPLAADREEHFFLTRGGFARLFCPSPELELWIDLRLSASMRFSPFGRGLDPTVLPFRLALMSSVEASS
jgi:hypothetical protein